MSADGLPETAPELRKVIADVRGTDELFDLIDAQLKVAQFHRSVREARATLRQMRDRIMPEYLAVAASAAQKLAAIEGEGSRR